MRRLLRKSVRRLLRKARSLKAGLSQMACKEIELLRARKLDIEDIKTVCLVLGPYRNLTTLTAAIVSLHPQCQVLNHAGARIFGDKRLNFFLNYEDAKFETFIRYAVYASRIGREGPYGGSITLSHAFLAQHNIKAMYERAHGDNLSKKKIHCLFWKESMATSNCIRDHHVDLHAIFAHNNKLRFMMPVRNPLDSAVSNLKFFGKAGLYELFKLQNREPGLEEILAVILDEFLRFVELKCQHPDRFFYFFEHEFGKETLLGLVDFLCIDADEGWYTDCLKAFDVKSRYQHSTDIVDTYNKLVKDKFSIYPEISKKLLQFTHDYQSVA